MTRLRTTPTRTSTLRRAKGPLAAALGAGAVVAALVVGAPAPALAAPPSTLEMSSFVSEVAGHDVVGGVRTVTVTNPNDDMVAASVSLGPAPCDCVVDSAAPSRGTHDGDTWDVGELGPGESATLTLRYVATSHVAGGVPDTGLAGPVPWLLVLAGTGVASATVWGISAGYAPLLRRLRNGGAALA